LSLGLTESHADSLVRLETEQAKLSSGHRDALLGTEWSKFAGVIGEAENDEDEEDSPDSSESIGRADGVDNLPLETWEIEADDPAKFVAFDGADSVSAAVSSGNVESSDPASSDGAGDEDDDLDDEVERLLREEDERLLREKEAARLRPGKHAPTTIVQAAALAVGAVAVFLELVGIVNFV
jgi:hypothetical protein